MELLFTLLGSILWNLLKAPAMTFSTTRVEAVHPSAPQLAWNKSPWFCKGTGSSRPEAVPGASNWHGPTQANSSAAKLEPPDFLLAYCTCSQVLLGLPQHFPCFLCCVILYSFFQKAFGKTMHLSLWAEWNCGTAMDDHHSWSSSACNLVAYHPKPH